MRVLELVAVLEAVAEQTIEADMGKPDQAERDDQRLVLPPPDSHDRGRQRGAVSQVVEMGAKTRAAEVADHRQVGNQQRERYQPPGSVRGRVGDQGADGKHGSLEAKQPPWRADNCAVRGRNSRRASPGHGHAGRGSHWRRFSSARHGIALYPANTAAGWMT